MIELIVRTSPNILNVTVCLNKLLIVTSSLNN